MGCGISSRRHLVRNKQPKHERGGIAKDDQQQPQPQPSPRPALRHHPAAAERLQIPSVNAIFRIDPKL
ncbi:hypothetical protein VTJ04DRAFT_765 [Mycothermus thermophilus]|uniref:uncharacterized protein n=1 Tax=Humicola insolens TaxID=85995 RepID=UPI003741F49B